MNLWSMDPQMQLTQRQLRPRRALTLFKDVPLRTRRALVLLYNGYGDNALLLLNRTLLNSVNTLLALNRTHNFCLEISHLFVLGSGLRFTMW